MRPDQVFRECIMEIQINVKMIDTVSRKQTNVGMVMEIEANAILGKK